MAEGARFLEPGAGSEETISLPMTAWNEGVTRGRSAPFPRQSVAGQDERTLSQAVPREVQFWQQEEFLHRKDIQGLEWAAQAVTIPGTVLEITGCYGSVDMVVQSKVLEFFSNSNDF